MALNLDRARMTVSGTPGTGTITLLAAATGYQTFANAGAVNTSVYSYLAEDGALWEYGTGTYSSTGPTLTRTVIRSSAGTSAVSLTSAALISITLLAEDIAALADAGANTDITSLTANAITPSGGTLSITGSVSSTSSTTLTPLDSVENTTNDANAGYMAFKKQRSGAVVQVNDTAGTFIWQVLNSGLTYSNLGYFNMTVDTAGATPTGHMGFYAGGATNSLDLFGSIASIAITTDAIATNSAALIVAGGVGIGKTVFIGGQTNLGAGTTTVAPLKYQSGTVLTTAAAGAEEYDGTVQYFTHAANERGVVPSEQFVQLSSAYTLTSQTAAQKLFNATANGQVTLSIGTYEFECFFTLSSMSATSGAFGFALGGTAVLGSQIWFAEANKAVLATAASAQNTVNTAANTAIVTATTATVGWAWIRGRIRVTTGGTLIPQVSLGVAAAAVVGINSHFKIYPVGNSTVANVGNWS